MCEPCSQFKITSGRKLWALCVDNKRHDWCLIIDNCTEVSVAHFLFVSNRQGVNETHKPLMRTYRDAITRRCSPISGTHTHTTHTYIYICSGVIPVECSPQNPRILDLSCMSHPADKVHSIFWSCLSGFGLWKRISLFSIFNSALSCLVKGALMFFFVLSLFRLRVLSFAALH